MPATRSRIASLLIFGALIATGARAADPSRNLEDYVILGLERAGLGNEAFIDSGNMGANNPGATVQLGKNAFMGDGTEMVGDLARALTGTSICELFTNMLLPPARSTIRCSGPDSFSPLPLIDPLPPLPVFAPGTTSVAVASGESAVLAPGAYGAVTVARGGDLELTGGHYELAGFTAARLAKITVDGPSTIDVAGSFRLGNAAVFGPTSGDVVVSVVVGGKLVRFGRQATAAVALYAPNAQVRFGKSFFGRGRFVGRFIASDKATMFVLQTTTTTTNTSMSTTTTESATTSTSTTTTTTTSSTTTTSTTTSSTTTEPTTTTSTTTTDTGPTTTSSTEPTTTTSSITTTTSTTSTSSTTTTSTSTTTSITSVSSTTTTTASTTTTTTTVPGSFCTMSPGSAGNSGGYANGPNGVITLNPSILPVTVGAAGIRSLTVLDQASLICFLPTNGTAAALCTGLSGCGGDMVINACSNPPILDLKTNGSGSGGQGGGVLTGHAIVAKLAVSLSSIGATPPGLASFVLPTTVCTTRGTFSISPAIANGVRTVADLIVMADQALRDPSTFTGPPITRTDIDDALSAINLGFDQCASIVACP